jgi:hypothetical protein
MQTMNTRLYGVCRKNLKLSESGSQEFVQAIDESIKKQYAVMHEHTVALFHKDIESLKEYVDVKFFAMDTKMDTRFAAMDVKMDTKFAAMDTKIDAKFALADTKFATRDDLSVLRADLLRTVYLTSLGQLLAIVASVISLVLILKK